MRRLSKKTLAELILNLEAILDRSDDIVLRQLAKDTLQKLRGLK